MTARPEPGGDAFYLIRVSGAVGKRLLGPRSDLRAVRAPACTVLRIESDGDAAEIAGRLRARGLDVLSISRVA